MGINTVIVSSDAPTLRTKIPLIVFYKHSDLGILFTFQKNQFCNLFAIQLLIQIKI